jgi:hypothetical protein
VEPDTFAREDLIFKTIANDMRISCRPLAGARTNLRFL